MRFSELSRIDTGMIGLCAGAVMVAVPLVIKVPLRPAPPVTAHLYRFNVKPGSGTALTKWVQFERDNHQATLNTLEDEAMYFEGVFPDAGEHPKFLYWVAVNGTPNPNARPKAIDAQFRDLEADVLVKGSRVELPLAYMLVPPFVQESIHALRTAR